MNKTSTKQVRKTQEERVALSDKLMTQAAISLLVKQGVNGTTLAAIGEGAGYSRGLATQRFASKAGLLAHVHDAVAAHWIGRMREVVADAVGVEALERAIDALEELIIVAPDEIKAMYLLRYASIDPAAEYRANVAKVHRAQRRDVQHWIESGKESGIVMAEVDAELAAELFCASVDGIVYRWLVNPTVPVRELYAQLRVELRHTLADDTTSGRKIKTVRRRA